MKIAIITEKLGTYAAKCSTKIANEAVERGYTVYETEPHEISHLTGSLIGQARVYNKSDEAQKTERIILDDMDVIHFRPNPPVDMAYLSTLWLLARIQHKVLVINNPDAVIKYPEKISPLMFPQFTPPTLITRDVSEVENFAAKYGDVIIKPLYEYGGSGIDKILKGEFAAHHTKLENLLQANTQPLIAQKALDISTGDKRIFFIGGEIAGAFVRRPAPGSFIANIAAGGSIHKAEITKREREFAVVLKPFLVENGIYICGIDVIDEHVTEINITSSVGFSQMEELYGEKPQIRLWDIIEEKLK